MRSIVTVLLAVTPLALQLAGRADTVPDAKEDLTRRVLDTELSIDLAAKSGVAILSTPLRKCDDVITRLGGPRSDVQVFPGGRGGPLG